jgi:hypothetical protein
MFSLPVLQSGALSRWALVFSSNLSQIRYLINCRITARPIFKCGLFSAWVQPNVCGVRYFSGFYEAVVGIVFASKSGIIISNVTHCTPSLNVPLTSAKT